jgi:hypothetical protein
MVDRLLPFSWERLIRIMERVRERLARSTRALEQGRIPYAVAGGNAVAAWVSRVDEGRIRTTADVDILMRRNDLDAAAVVLGPHGFVRTEVLGVPMFLDGPDGKPSQAIHILIAGEKVRPEYVAPAPDVDESEMMEGYRATDWAGRTTGEFKINRGGCWATNYSDDLISTRGRGYSVPDLRSPFIGFRVCLTA